MEDITSRNLEETRGPRVKRESVQLVSVLPARVGEAAREGRVGRGGVGQSRGQKLACSDGVCVGFLREMCFKTPRQSWRERGVWTEGPAEACGT